MEQSNEHPCTYSPGAGCAADWFINFHHLLALFWKGNMLSTGSWTEELMPPWSLLSETA